MVYYLTDGKHVRHETFHDLHYGPTYFYFLFELICHNNLFHDLGHDYHGRVKKPFL